MEFCQSGNVGTLGYCRNDILLIRWNFYVNIDPKVIGTNIKNIQKIYLDFFFWKTWKNIMEFCQSGNVGISLLVLWFVLRENDIKSERFLFWYTKILFCYGGNFSWFHTESLSVAILQQQTHNDNAKAD